MLAGHAYRWIPVGEPAAIDRLVKGLDVAGAIDALDRSSNGAGLAREGLDPLASANDRAARSELGMLLACVPA